MPTAEKQLLAQMQLLNRNIEQLNEKLDNDQPAETTPDDEMTKQEKDLFLVGWQAGIWNVLHAMNFELPDATKSVANDLINHAERFRDQNLPMQHWKMLQAALEDTYEGKPLMSWVLSRLTP